MNLQNWKTTLIGFLAAVWFAIQPILSKGDFEIHRDWKSLVYASIFAVFGLLTKDHDTTGNPPTKIESTDPPIESKP